MKISNFKRNLFIVLLILTQSTFFYSQSLPIVGYGDAANYTIGTYYVPGSSGLDLHWHGGIRFGDGTSSSVMQISNGNVGIGTTAPSFRLDVNGILNLTSENNGGGLRFNSAVNGHSDSRNWYISSDGYAYGDLVFKSSSTFNGIPNETKLIIKSNGNLGIGTTTPSAKLDVNGNIAVGGLSAGSDDSPLSKKIAAYNYQSIEAGAIDFLDFNSTRHASSIAFRAKNASNAPEEFMRIVGQNGNVGIGTKIPDSKLTVNGTIHATEVKVTQTVPADYVFQKYYTGESELKPEYHLPTLSEVEKFTQANHHLPNVPSAAEIQENGLLLGEMSNILLQKIEEMTLYIIEQNNKIEVQQKENNIQSKKIEVLERENETFKSLSERLSQLENQLK